MKGLLLAARPAETMASAAAVQPRPHRPPPPPHRPADCGPAAGGESNAATEEDRPNNRPEFRPPPADDASTMMRPAESPNNLRDISEEDGDGDENDGPAGDADSEDRRRTRRDWVRRRSSLGDSLAAISRTDPAVASSLRTSLAEYRRASLEANDAESSSSPSFELSQAELAGRLERSIVDLSSADEVDETTRNHLSSILGILNDTDVLIGEADQMLGALGGTGRGEGGDGGGRLERTASSDVRRVQRERLQGRLDERNTSNRSRMEHKFDRPPTRGIFEETDDHSSCPAVWLGSSNESNDASSSAGPLGVGGDNTNNTTKVEGPRYGRSNPPPPPPPRRAKADGAARDGGGADFARAAAEIRQEMNHQASKKANGNARFSKANPPPPPPPRPAPRVPAGTARAQSAAAGNVPAQALRPASPMSPASMGLDQARRRVESILHQVDELRTDERRVPISPGAGGPQSPGGQVPKFRPPSAALYDEPLFDTSEMDAGCYANDAEDGFRREGFRGGDATSDCSRMSGRDPSVISGYTAGSERAPTIDEGREFGRKGSRNSRDGEILRPRKGAGRKMTGRGFNSRARRNNQDGGGMTNDSTARGAKSRKQQSKRNSGRQSKSNDSSDDILEMANRLSSTETIDDPSIIEGASDEQYWRDARGSPRRRDRSGKGVMKGSGRASRGHVGAVDTGGRPSNMNKNAARLNSNRRRRQHDVEADADSVDNADDDLLDMASRLNSNLDIEDPEDIVGANDDQYWRDVRGSTRRRDNKGKGLMRGTGASIRRDQRQSKKVVVSGTERVRERDREVAPQGLTPSELRRWHHERRKGGAGYGKKDSAGSGRSGGGQKGGRRNHTKTQTDRRQQQQKAPPRIDGGAGGPVLRLEDGDSSDPEYDDECDDDGNGSVRSGSTRQSNRSRRSSQSHHDRPSSLRRSSNSLSQSCHSFRAGKSPPPTKKKGGFLNKIMPGKRRRRQQQQSQQNAGTAAQPNKVNGGGGHDLTSSFRSAASGISARSVLSSRSLRQTSSHSLASNATGGGASNRSRGRRASNASDRSGCSGRSAASRASGRSDASSRKSALSASSKKSRRSAKSSGGGFFSRKKRPDKTAAVHEIGPSDPDGPPRRSDSIRSLGSGRSRRSSASSRAAASLLSAEASLAGAVPRSVGGGGNDDGAAASGSSHASWSSYASSISSGSGCGEGEEGQNGGKKKRGALGLMRGGWKRGKKKG